MSTLRLCFAFFFFLVEINSALHPLLEVCDVRALTFLWIEVCHQLRTFILFSSPLLTASGVDVRPSRRTFLWVALAFSILQVLTAPRKF